MRRVIQLGRRGQALLLVTLSLFAMCGLLGLAIDLGWAYFIKKSAQNAADAAALAAAYQALNANGETVTPFPNPGGSGGDCDLSGNLQTACQYAEQNDFNPGGHGGRQKINITADQGPLTRQDTSIVPSCSPAVLVGCVEYRVTVRTVEAIPQLFSAILGNSAALSSARSTAAVVQEFVNGSLILLNRNDATEGGIDAVAAPIVVTAGIVVASTLPGTIPKGIAGPVIAMNPVANPGLPDGPQFLDPMRGYGQPPLPTADPDGQCGKSLCTYAVMGSDMSSSSIFRVGVDSVADTSHDYVGSGLLSGNYVSATWRPGCGITKCHSVTPSGNQLGIGGTVTFNDSSVTFGYYIFYGGLSVGGGKMLMGPGEYMFVGGGAAGDLTTTNTADIEGTGAILIFSGASGPFTGDITTAAGPTDLYPNLILTQINSNELLVAAAEMGILAFGPVTLANGPKVNVSGIDPTSPSIPQNLVPFGGIVMWQDQANSTVKYLPDGNIDLSCGGINSPCPKTVGNPVINVQALSNLGFTGTIYQPRGASINVGSGVLQGNLQVITGAVTGGGGVNLTPPANLNLRLRRRVVALIE